MPINAIGSGYRCTSRLQRYGSVASMGLTARGANTSRSRGTNAPRTSVASAAMASTTTNGFGPPRPTLARARATRIAATRPRSRVTSTLGPMKPNSAGSNVTEAIIVTSTVIAAPTPRPWKNGRPMSSRPSSEMTTVIPANSTARPAVSMARAVASDEDLPLRSSSRYRVTMNSA